MTTAGLFVALAALVASAALLYLLLRARLDRRLARLAPEDPAREVRDELGSVMVEMNRTTERNIALLEDKIEQLGRLLGEADRKIALLHREIEKNEASRMVYSHLARASERREAEESARVRAPEPAPAVPAPEEKQPEPLESRVLRLEREGFSAGVIANRVGSTVGEVELIISLSRRRT